MKLSPQQRRTILDNIDDIFQKIKARLMGRFFSGPRIYFEVVKQSNPFETIEGLFRYVTYMTGGPSSKIDEHQVEVLSEVTGNYVDAKRLQVQNKVLNAIAAAATPKQALKAVESHINDAGDYMEALVSNETHTATAYANKEGITKVGASIGIEDPTVCKVGVIDDKMCSTCRELWHDPDNIYKPRPWKLSQLKEGYMTDRENPYPTVGGSHPRCRHTLVFLPPNMAPDEKGTFVWKKFGYDYYENYKKKGGNNT